MYIHIPDGKRIEDIQKRVRNVLSRYQFIPGYESGRTRDEAIKLYANQCGIKEDHIRNVLSSKEEPCEALLNSVECEIWKPEPTVYV